MIVLYFSRQSINKIRCASQNTEAKNLPADVCVFGRFRRLSLTAVHSNCSQFDSEMNGCIHVSTIVTYLRKNSFLLRWNSCKQRSESSARCCFWSTVSKHGTDFEYSFLIDNSSCKMVHTLPCNIFYSSAITSNFNLRSAQTSLWSSLEFSGTTAEFEQPELSASFVSTFKVSIPPLNQFFRRSRVQITLIKLLLCLNSIFSHQKPMLYQHTKCRFFHCFENLHSSFT